MSTVEHPSADAPVPGAGPGWRIERVGYGHPDAALLIEEVQAEYVVRYGGPDRTPLDPAMFDPPTGSFYVGYLGSVPVATGAWRFHEDLLVFGSTRTAEVKRMYVGPSARGRGLARAMLAHLETTAAAAGYEVIVLETGSKQPEAMALYESSGYLRIPGFGFYKDAPLNRCYGKPLVPGLDVPSR